MAESPRLIINECLAGEWSFRPEDGSPSETWPFELEYWGAVDDWQLYRFDDGGISRYAGYAPEIGVISGAVADMTLDDLADEFRGGDWILERRPVELNDADAEEDDSVPSRAIRLRAIEELAVGVLGPDTDFEILRGFYLEASGDHLALVRRPRSREAMVVCTCFAPLTVAYAKASPERRMAIAIGRHIATFRPAAAQ